MSHHTTPEDDPRSKIVEAGGIEDAPDLDTPDLDELDLETPDLDELDLDTPDLDAPDLDTPDLDALDLETPDLDELDLPRSPDGVPDALRGLAAEAGADASGLPAGAPAPQPEASSFLIGPDAVRAFVAREWKRRLDYRLKKEVWTYSGDQVSILFEYEWHDAETDQWMLTHGEEHWEIAADGLLRRIKATSQDIAIAEIDRLVPPRPILGPTPVD